MMRLGRSGLVWLTATILLALAMAALAGTIARHRARAALSTTVATDARLRASLLDSEIARYRLVPLAFGDDRDVVAALAGTVEAKAALNRKLEALARTTGAAALYVVDSRGIALAASNWRTPTSFVGTNYRFRRYVRDAFDHGAAAQYALGTVSRRPGLYLSRRTGGGTGVVVIKLEFDGLEADWARAGGTTVVRDATGMIVVTSRPEWRFADTLPLSPAAHVLATVPTRQPGWTLTLARSAAVVERSPARAAALGAGFAVVALAALAWGLRQRALLRRQRTTELEAAVAIRTAELTREMEERAAGEVRAAELRERLRQANRLATLGQVTASVAHETTQPVAAIKTYARTSATLLDRGDSDTVRANLAAIDRLTDRIGAVTDELRGFARRRTDVQRPVSLSEVVDGALLILKEQLRAVRLDRPAIDAALMVSGGRIRLEQVLVNILQNAVEALRDRVDARIALHLTAAEDRVVLAVQDNGPGVSPDVAARLFTPFVTSRPDGLGLGLVISHDIMVEFGGTLRHVPTDSGTRFEMEMVRA